MIECKLYILDIGRTILNLGKQGENNATKFLIDATKWTEEWPEGKIRGAFKTPDGVLRETEMTLSEGVIEWPITSSETALYGNGQLEIQLTDDAGTVVKSATCVTVVSPSISYKADDQLQPPFSEGGGSGEKGPKGDPGVGISDVKLNEDYTLTITLTDGNSYTTKSVRGEKGEPGAAGKDGLPGERGPEGPKGDDGDPGIPGKDGSPGPKGDKGNGVKNIELQGDYTLKFTMDDESVFTTTSVRGPEGAQGAKGDNGLPGERGPEGPKGDDGDPGIPGKDGSPGPKGDKGNGVKNIELQGDYTLKFTMDDESVFTTTSVRGPEGAQGAKGDNGLPGERGPEGPKGDDGARGTKLFLSETGSEGIQDDYEVGDICINTSTWEVEEYTSPDNWESKGIISGGGSSGPALSDTAPKPMATNATSGAASDASRSDHVHPLPTKEELMAIIGELNAVADRLKEAHMIQVDLKSTEAVAFDGTADIKPGVVGPLPIKLGGTGASTVSDAGKMLGVPDIAVSTVDLVPGESTLKSNRFYFHYLYE